VSDFLLNLARRGAGLAPAVRSRDLPPPEIATAPLADAAPASRAVPPPVSSAPVNVIQREPLPPSVASPAPAASLGVVVPPPAPEVAAANGEHPAVAETVLPTVVPVIAAVPELRSQAPPTAGATETLVEHHTTTRVVEIVPAAVALSPRRENEQSIAVTSVRVEPPQAPPADRLVQVRIGAIEIVGPPLSAPPPAAPPVAPPPARVQGFDDFSALRTYAPFHW
jgi:hypothetical protein